MTHPKLRETKTVNMYMPNTDNANQQVTSLFAKRRLYSSKINFQYITMKQQDRGRTVLIDCILSVYRTLTISRDSRKYNNVKILKNSQSL